MTESKTETLFILLFASLAASFFFAFFCIPLSADISILAFPISFAFTAIVFYKSILLKRGDASAIPVVRKMMQYLPYVLLASFVLRRAGKNGTPFWYDIATVSLWCIVFVSSLAALYFLNEKRVYALSPEWKKYREKNPSVKPRGFARAAFEALDWADALVQAIFMVLLIQIFIVQLYMIPSESMVPEFLVGDRVVVFKTASGPKFPLSDVGVPSLKTYERGDVVVFRNPHYSMDRKSEVKTVTSQLVYLLTFMAVNLNKDENGRPKPDPLVKRVAGVPGEQLVMQDGVLYARTKDGGDFKPVEKDARFAAWNLNDVAPKAKRGIREFPLSQSEYDLMIECEKRRREYDIDAASLSCRALVERFRRAVPDRSGTFTMDASSMHEYNLFVNFDALTQRLMSADGGTAWFSSFMTDWIASKPEAGSYAGGDIYSDANYRLNIMIKECVGSLIVRNAELIKAASSSDARRSDGEIRSLMERAEMLNLYVMLLDQRNMPVFPENKNGRPQYIPEGAYFMMGDNRFNSADMRHSYTKTLTPLTKLDAYSVTYESNMSPQYVGKKYILGTTLFRFWPPSRIGAIGKRR
ncbi:signal peptidase I [Treponema socranskii]|uniref:signal peptidase I n=1 Tax=Treponema socranskii TaxID=53419 RepID=UPI0028E545DC|nr:signal peptidase I [Treponema socranskii]